MTERGNEEIERDRLLMTALRETAAILRELSMRYEVSTFRQRPVARGGSVRIPEDIARMLAPEMESLMQEQLRVVLLDTRLRVMGQHLVYQGSVNSIQHVRHADVFREAVVDGVPRIAVVHNHPSGDPEPSQEDVVLTGFLMEAGRILGIEVLDHIIIGQRGSFVSLRTRGLPRSSRWPAL